MNMIQIDRETAIDMNLAGFNVYAGTFTRNDIISINNIEILENYGYNTFLLDAQDIIKIDEVDILKTISQDNFVSETYQYEVEIICMCVKIEYFTKFYGISKSLIEINDIDYVSFYNRDRIDYSNNLILGASFDGEYRIMQFNDMDEFITATEKHKPWFYSMYIIPISNL